MSDEDLRAEIARLRAGESDAPRRPGVTPTPAQWIKIWNELPPERRLQKVEHILRSAEQAERCFLMDHEDHIENLRKQLEVESNHWTLLNANLYLVGDEDGGVALHCRDDDCFDGARPLAYYATHGSGYASIVVMNVTTIRELLQAAAHHLKHAHGEDRS